MLLMLGTGETYTKGIRWGEVAEITIQQKIDAARSYKGVTQQQLADAFGITVQAMGQRLKTGKFTQLELEKIASVLDAKYKSYFEFSDGTKF